MPLVGCRPCRVFPRGKRHLFAFFCLAPSDTVESELKQHLLVDLFPSELVMDDEFCIYIKKGKRGTEKNKLVIAFLFENFSGFLA
jgi:hypothetical protein